MIHFSNTYTQLPDDFYVRVVPATFSSPQLILFNKDLARELQIEIEGAEDQELAAIFSGQKLLPGSEPIAQAYAGFQFGHPVPQLGDGRALLLGETNGFDIQLKGSGQTPFSRGGDGRSALGPVLREYIVSEAMYHLGVPTTRALAAVTTGENVERQWGPEPGGVFTRVASSHIRVGTFQYFWFKEDLMSIETLIEYTLCRHYPEFLTLPNIQAQCLALLKELTARQSELIAQWASFGFIHGVMNTDNFSVAGLTIDYGPCAFMDEFSYDKVFSSIDRHGRYSFWNQLSIAQWNIMAFAHCLLPFIDDNPEKAAEIVNEEVKLEVESFQNNRFAALAKKLGIQNYDEKDNELVSGFLDLLQEHQLDFTLSFRHLPELFNAEWKNYPKTTEFEKFVATWKNRVANVDHLNEINPLYIARNHQVEKAIQEAYKGNYQVFYDLVNLLKSPFTKNDQLHSYHTGPLPNERVEATFCGT